MNSSSELKKPVGKRGFSMINVGDDGKITNPFRRELAQIEAVFLSLRVPLNFRKHLVVVARREAAVLLTGDRRAPPPLDKLYTANGSSNLEAIEYSCWNNDRKGWKEAMMVERFNSGQRIHALVRGFWARNLHGLGSRIDLEPKF